MLTLFLSALWGPTLLALGAGFLISPTYYKRLYRDLDRSPLTLLMISMFLIPLGITQVLFYNSWRTFTEGLISFLGWGMLVKGIVMAVFPKLVHRAGADEAKAGLIPVAGVGMLILGLYLTMVAF